MPELPDPLFPIRGEQVAVEAFGPACERDGARLQPVRVVRVGGPPSGREGLEVELRLAPAGLPRDDRWRERLLRWADRVRDARWPDVVEAIWAGRFGPFPDEVEPAFADVCRLLFPLSGVDFSLAAHADEDGRAEVRIAREAAPGALPEIVTVAVELLPPEGAPDPGWRATLRAWADALAGSTWDEVQDRIAEGRFSPFASAEDVAFAAWVERHRAVLEPAEVAAALARVEPRFRAMAAHFAEVYGMRLPRQLLVFLACWDALPPVLRGRLEDRIRLTWLLDWCGTDRRAREGLDLRLHGRYRSDPPELVSVLHGDTDGLHWGLWYDDPRHPPVAVVHSFARDSAETWLTGASLLDVLREELIRWDDGDDHPEAPLRARALNEVLARFADAEADALAADAAERPAWLSPVRPDVLGGFGPAVPPGAGEIPARGELDEVDRAWREAPDRVRGWIARARAELAAGRPAFALALGREAHWLDDERWRDEGHALLVDAYRALGRDALAAVAELHHRHRDLPSVDVLARD